MRSCRLSSTRFLRSPLRQAVHAAALALPLSMAMASLPVLAAQPVSAQQIQRFDIPAGPLSTVLSRFASEANVMLSVDATLTEGKQSQGLKGQYSVNDGFAELLRGSGLNAVDNGNGGYTLISASAQDAGVTALSATTVTDFALGNALGEVSGYNATHSQIATKTSKSILETSQSVSVVTREQMDDQGSQTVSQALRYTPGVMTSPYGATHRYDYVAMRGFNEGSVDNIYLDGLKTMGDSGTYSSMQVDPYFLERIDILKGPSSVLYGRSNPGGLVALTSKKPLYEPYHEIQATVGTQGQRGIGFDFGGPVDEDQRIAYRLVGLADKSDTQFDVEEKRYAIAPTVAIDLDDDTTLTLQAYLQHDPEGGYHGGLPAEGTLYRHNGQYISNSFFEGDSDYDKFERTQQMVGYQFEHRFNDVWSARQNFRYLDGKVDMRQAYQTGWVGTSNELSRATTEGKERLHAWIVDNMLQAEFETGAAKHTLLTGIDYQRRKAKVDYSGGTASTIDAFNPVYGDADVVNTWETSNLRRMEQTGLYVQDLIDLDKWRFSLGLRKDWVETSSEDLMYGTGKSEAKDSKLTPRVGALYLFDNGIAPYISYSESFNPNSYTDQSGDPLEATEGKQWEAGIKYQPPGTDNIFTASVFHIVQENLATKLANEQYYRAVGEVRSQGFELEAHMQVTDNFRVLGSYTFADVEYVKSEDGTEGNTPNVAPRHMASVWGDYTFNEGTLRGLSFGAGSRFVSKSWADPANTQRIPAYTLFDASVGYDLSNVGLKGMDIRVNANNLTDKEYIAACNSLSYCYYGEERNVTATVSYKF
ncbi:iron complex outermembrane receptor protein [Pseudomonas duriflava]|uniref:Metal-pseudopaline receptor CntO n=1 Tax=Pseudomonas duriflava TaxID=459528 RepID=A0A562QAM3_9PSED|nr:TonB-dependent siderophore receptor [Pseudomonas duriflava]TWI53807.1 iron complex outermembrane receptor protein [Pseudomonas duriflava]